jgi:predicted patatin/cPLA2 family phospholipase
MSQAINQEISKAKEKSYLREIETLLSRLKENSKSIKSENKQIERLRKANDKSFVKLKRAVESLQTY